MKKIEFQFKVNGYCAMVLDVPDDYQVPSTNPEVFWEDLKEKAGDQIMVDLMDLSNSESCEFPLLNLILEYMELDHFQSVYLSGEDGKDIEIKFDRGLFDR